MYIVDIFANVASHLVRETDLWRMTFRGQSTA